MDDARANPAEVAGVGAGIALALAPRMLVASPPRPAPRRPTVATGAVRRVLDLAERDGLPYAGITRATRLSPSVTADPDARVGFEQLVDLWAHVARTLDDPSLPIRVARRSTIEDLHVLGFAIMAAPTLRLALDTFARFGALLTDAGRWEVTVSGGRVEARSLRPLPRTLGERLSIESSVAQFTTCLRQLAGEDVEPLAVSFRHDRPRARTGHEAFFGCKVAFGAPWDGLVLRPEVLERRPPGANEALFGWLSQRVASLAAELEPTSTAQLLRDRLARHLAESDAAMPSSGALARSLGLTERTLRRRLQADGTSMRIVLEEVRRDAATALLRCERTSVTDAALRLGFSDTSAFSHACRRWFGCAPSELRRRAPVV